MDPMQSADRFVFDCPAVYRVRVAGSLATSWSDRLAGMTISPETPDEGPPSTTLVGELPDQASLAGVLDTLYELHRAVLLVECLFAGERAANDIATTPSPRPESSQGHSGLGSSNQPRG
jgi:hypothetical protein